LQVARHNNGRWQLGQSGNPSGRGVGTRNRFSEKFVSDVAAVWDQHGASVLEKMVTDEPARFAELCGRLIPRDVQVSLQTRMPGGLEPDDWQAIVELLSAVKAALPNDQRKPGEIAELVIEALRSHQAPMIDATRLEHADKT
jgi:hypothetical protein